MVQVLRHQKRLHLKCSEQAFSSSSATLQGKILACPPGAAWHSSTADVRRSSPARRPSALELHCASILHSPVCAAQLGSGPKGLRVWRGRGPWICSSLQSLSFSTLWLTRVPSILFNLHHLAIAGTQGSISVCAEHKKNERWHVHQPPHKSATYKACAWPCDTDAFKGI